MINQRPFKISIASWRKVTTKTVVILLKELA
jgi:hypothetical protein